MTYGRNKYQSRENRAEVRHVLMRDWDPIGVSSVPEAADEYDSYVGTVYVMLMDQRSNAEIIELYLWTTATEHMGLSESQWLRERCENTALRLVELRPKFELQ